MLRGGKHLQVTTSTETSYAMTATRPATKPFLSTPRSPRVVTTPTRPYSSVRTAAHPVSPNYSGNGSSLVTGLALSFFDCGDGDACGSDNSVKSTPAQSRTGGNPVLEAEAKSLDSLKRRRSMELRQLLSFELRSLAKEEHDRLLADKARAREAAAEAKRKIILDAADRARLTRERSGREREKKAERQAADKRARQEEALRQLEEQDRLKRRQAELAAERRAELMAQKAVVLKGRIDRGVRVRRAKQLRNQRLAAKKADEREAAAEAAKMFRESEHAAKKAAAAERWAAARAAVEEARRRRDQEALSMRERTGGEIVEKESRAASFRTRRKETEERERELREEEMAALARERQEAARRKVNGEAQRRAKEVEDKALRENQNALEQEMRKEKEAARRRAESRERNEIRKGMMERKAEAEKKRREATRHKLEQDAAKVELLRSEMGRLKAKRWKLSLEASKQRKALHRHFEALKSQSHGCSISYGELAVAVAAAATTAAAGPGGDIDAAAHQNVTTPAASSRTFHFTPTPAVRAASASPKAPSCSSSSHFPSRGQTGSGACAQVTAHPPPARSECPASVEGTVSSLSFATDGDFRGDCGLTPSPPAEVNPRTARQPSVQAKSPNRARIKPCKTSGRGGRSRRKVKVEDPAAVGLRERYDNTGRSGINGRGGMGMGGRTKIATRASRAMTRSRKNKGVKVIVAVASSEKIGRRNDKNDITPTNAGCSTKRPQPKTARDALGGSYDASEKEYGDDETMAAAKVMLPQTNLNIPEIPPKKPVMFFSPSPPPPVAPGSNIDLLRGKYDRELLAILEEEQAAEVARERLLSAAKARAKAAQARACSTERRSSDIRGGVNSVRVAHNRINDGGEDCRTQAPSPSPNGEPVVKARTTTISSATPTRAVEAGDGGHDFGSAEGDMQRREEEAAIATSDVIRLEKEFATERREASERVLLVSEAYEKALLRFSSKR